MYSIRWSRSGVTAGGQGADHAEAGVEHRQHKGLNNHTADLQIDKFTFFFAPVNLSIRAVAYGGKSVSGVDIFAFHDAGCSLEEDEGRRLIEAYRLQVE